MTRSSFSSIVIAALWLGSLICPSSPALNAGPFNPREPNSPAYIEWLEKQSMLAQARIFSKPISGKGVQWSHRYGKPQPRDVVKSGSVWVLGYPGSVIAPEGMSVIGTWADPKLWETFREIGIDVLHTGPVHLSGGIRGGEYTPTTDGWFDPISLEIDPHLGTEKDYESLVKSALNVRGSIAGDLVPLHTGKGADFLLALRAYRDYPGMYTLVEIPKERWDLLPTVSGEAENAPISRAAVQKLTDLQLLPGAIDSVDAVKNALELTGWDATGEISGVDGKLRRWAYLHFFKDSQPALNWLDPSSAAQRALGGDISRLVFGMGTRILRLDAIPFMALEPVPGKLKTLSFEHPWSVEAANYLAALTRKLGGWTFHELNVPLDQLRMYTENGADLSYDFFTRTETVNALLTGDATLLRRSNGILIKDGIEHVSLVHDLQNHDEITYQLVDLASRGDQIITYHGKPITARSLREKTIATMQAKAVGSGTPFNLLYRPQKDGLATTFAGFIAAALGIKDPYHATAAETQEIKRGHLLLAYANAMQPGVFSLSSWDLVGALPLPRVLVQERLGDDDFRWVNRGGVDLMGRNPGATRSVFGLPRATALYGTLPEQLKQPDSFVSRLRKMLKARKTYQIDLATVIEAPDTRHQELSVLVMALPAKGNYAVTAVNFGRKPVREMVRLLKAKLGGAVFRDIFTGEKAGAITRGGMVSLSLKGWEARTFVIQKR